MSAVPTRVTGMLMVAAVSVTLIAGILPLSPRAESRGLRLALFGCSLVCVLIWMAVSVRSRRAGGVDLDKPARPARRPSRSLPVLLAVLLPLASGAALVQAGRLLALVSACTPWLALTWVIKRV